MKSHQRACWMLFLFQMVSILIPISINVIQLIWILTFFIPKKKVYYQVRTTIPHEVGNGYELKSCTLSVLGGISDDNFMECQDDIRENYGFDKEFKCFIEFTRL